MGQLPVPVLMRPQPLICVKDVGRDVLARGCGEPRRHRAHQPVHAHGQVRLRRLQHQMFRGRRPTRPARGRDRNK